MQVLLGGSQRNDGMTGTLHAAGQGEYMSDSIPAYYGLFVVPSC